jgi:hypothetical protein
MERLFYRKPRNISGKRCLKSKHRRRFIVVRIIDVKRLSFEREEKRFENVIIQKNRRLQVYGKKNHPVYIIKYIFML